MIASRRLRGVVLGTVVLVLSSCSQILLPTPFGPPGDGGENDAPQVQVATSSITVNPQSLSMAEGAPGASYTMVLDTQPLSEVTVATAGTGEISVSPAALAFDSSSWNTPQTVTVSAVDDADVEGPHSSRVLHTVASGDPAFDGLFVTDVSVSIADNDAASVLATPGTVSVSEAGPTSDSFDVVLTTLPSDDVTITLATGGETTLGSTSFTFTAADWDIPQTATVTAIDDAAAEGAHADSVSFTVASADSNYDALLVPDVTVNITDNDAPAVTVAPASVSVDEAGPTSATFTVVLETVPTGNVDVGLSVLGDVTVSPASLTFTTLNWSTPQTLTVTAIDDGFNEGPHNDTVTFTLTSTDGNYNALAVPGVAVNIADNEQYFVIYNANGADNGTPPTDPALYSFGDTATALGNTGGLIKDGAVFSGWNTAADGSGTSIPVGGLVSIGVGDVTLYAEWDTSTAGFAGGSGTPGDPYQVATAEQLSNVRTNLAAEYIQTADIDLGVPPWDSGSGDGWDPIAGDFSGVYDGDGFVISNLFINRPTSSRQALFEYLVGSATARIRNVALENVDITGENIVGTIVASGDSVPPSDGRIVDSYATGILRGSEQLGGLVSRSRQISIEGSFADVTVTAISGSQQYVGGLVGWAGSGSRPIADSYALGDVTGIDAVGGLVGYQNGGDIERSYAAGVVSGSTNTGGLVGLQDSGSVTDSVYNTNTTGQSDLGKGEPLSTAEMTTETTFTARGWDFAAIWNIVGGSSYPYQEWYGGAPPTP